MPLPPGKLRCSCCNKIVDALKTIGSRCLACNGIAEEELPASEGSTDVER